MRARAFAVVKLRLQGPDFAHGGGKALRHAPAFFNIVAQIDDGRIHGRRAFLPLRQIVLPMAVELRPQHRRQHKAHRHRFIGAQTLIGVIQRQRHNVLLLVLAALLQGGEQRVDIGIHAQLVQLLQALAGMAGKQKLHDFIKKPRHRLLFQTACITVYRLGGGVVHLKTELARKAHRPQNAHRVFLIARGGVAYHHQPARPDIGHTVVKINDFLPHRVVIERIAGEIAPHGIFFHIAISVVFHNAAVLVLLHLAATAESGYFDRFRPHHHMHNLKAPPDNAAAAKHLAHLFGRGIGSHIKIFRLDAQKQITHRAAHHISFKAFMMQAAHHFFRRKAEHIGTDTVLTEIEHIFMGTRFGVFARQHFVQPFFQHNIHFN